MSRVLVALSGGVDSAVAAALLLQQGHTVEGAVMQLNPADDGSTVADARRVAQTLGIPCRVLDLRERFTHEVIDPFCDRYLAGQTPNPCILCNRALKFGAFSDAAAQLGFDAMATGHYARIVRDDAGFHLLRADSVKDQTYVLYGLTQNVLAHLLLPLGYAPDKAAVRRIAAGLGLDAADRPDSQEICFVPDKDYAAFIRSRRAVADTPGDFTDAEGNVLGRHKGLLHYTVGQRKGLGIALGERRFVVALDPEHNRVILGDDRDCFRDRLTAGCLSFVSGAAPKAPLRVQVKVRYSATPSPATLTVSGDTAQVVFDAPERAVTPGQAAVFYQGDEVLGGGTIR